MTIVAVSDTGPLIHLGEIQSLELLEVFGRLSVPETVYDELERGGVPNGLEKDEPTSLPVRVPVRKRRQRPATV